ncbi:unnamed protein product [Polarella glacialis]|uniref:Uncharacterized protein n=1 Tax=Polarella glacialis TaxID=89957 RepID=A0A813L3Q4_POLGL|nr:unnamed protein product [Polarella glacialis]
MRGVFQSPGRGPGNENPWASSAQDYGNFLPEVQHRQREPSRNFGAKALEEVPPRPLNVGRLRASTHQMPDSGWQRSSEAIGAFSVPVHTPRPPAVHSAPASLPAPPGHDDSYGIAPAPPELPPASQLAYQQPRGLYEHQAAQIYSQSPETGWAPHLQLQHVQVQKQQLQQQLQQLQMHEQHLQLQLPPLRLSPGEGAQHQAMAQQATRREPSYSPQISAPPGPGPGPGQNYAPPPPRPAYDEAARYLRPLDRPSHRNYEPAEPSGQPPGPRQHQYGAPAAYR